jgi:tetratricopeptide (TPR) repeat protein
LAQSSSDELARRHFDSGVAYLQESDYDNALQAFQKAYELSKRPEILLNIATVHERKGSLKLAIDSLNAYLTAAPQGDQVDTVRLRITNLQKRVDAEPSGAAPAPPATTPPAAEPASPAPAPGPATPAPAPAAEQTPNRIPAYILFGVGGLTGIGAVVTGVMAQGKYDDAEKSCSPTCTDSQLSSSKTLAWTSTALTGVAIVSAGVGAVLFFTAGGSDEQAPAGATAGVAPATVGFAAAPGFASAQASWRF